MAVISAQRRRGVGRPSAIVAVLLWVLLATGVATAHNKMQVSDPGRATTLPAVGHQVDLAVASRHERTSATQPGTPLAAALVNVGIATPRFSTSRPLSASAPHARGAANAHRERAPPLRETI